MNDILAQRLREWADSPAGFRRVDLLHEAANRIEKLEKERGGLRAGLKNMTSWVRSLAATDDYASPESREDAMLDAAQSTAFLQATARAGE